MRRIIYGFNIMIIVLSFIAIIYTFFDNGTNKNTIKVEVKGAVVKEGVYELDANSRVEDAITKSGGLTDKADVSIINLSKKLEDEDVIFVYTKEEVEEMRQGSTSVKYIERECVCPKVDNAACIDNIISDSESVINKSGKVSLNTATLEELLTIPNIGESKAKLIMEYRQKTPFTKIEDIMNIKGIGNGIFEKIKDYITI